MSKLEISGYWNVLRGRVKQLLATCTDDDFHLFQGRQEERLGRMQKRIGKSHASVEKAVRDAVCSFYFSPEQVTS